MIGLKTILVLLNIALYVSLFVGFVKVIEWDVDGKCTEKTPCIRFCSKDNDTITDLDLMKHFRVSYMKDHGTDRTSSITNIGNITTYGSYSGIVHKDSSHYQVFRGQPECIDEENLIKNFKNHELKVRLKHFLLLQISYLKKKICSLMEMFHRMKLIIVNTT